MPQKLSKDVKKLIKTARKTLIANLSRQELVEIPEEVVDLTKVESLILHDNRIINIPTEIGLLTCLKVLNLSNNQIYKVPRSIAELRNLVTLNLNNNKLEELPKHVSKLTQLEELCIGNNMLTELHHSISGLSSLKILVVDGNQISNFPPEIAKLSSLKKLTASRNKLVSVGGEIIQLHNLEYLDLSSNQIMEVSPEIKNLHCLTSLILNNNQLMEIPYYLVEMPTLVTIILDNNPLKLSLQRVSSKGVSAIIHYLRSKKRQQDEEIEQQQRKKITQLLEQSQSELQELKKELELQKELISTSPVKKDFFESAEVKVDSPSRSKRYLHMSAPPVMAEQTKDGISKIQYVDIDHDTHSDDFNLDDIKSSHMRTASNSTEEEVKVLLKKLLKKEREKARQEKTKEKSKKKEEKHTPGNYRSFPTSPEVQPVYQQTSPRDEGNHSLDTLRLSNRKESPRSWNADKEKIAELEKTIELLNGQLSTSNDELVKKDIEIGSLREIIKKLEEEKEMLDTLVDSIQEKHRENLQSLADLNLTVLQMEQEKDELVKKNGELQKKLSQHQTNQLQKSAKKSEHFLKLVSEETKVEYDTLKANYENLKKEFDIHREREGKQWIIKGDELQSQEEIGRGEFGIVLKGVWRYTQVAIKQLYSDNIPADQVQEFIQEANIAKGLRPHTNVVQLLGICLEPKISIITEYMPNGTVYALLHSKAQIDITTIAKLALGAAAGMHHLHTENIIHRDLAARNLLLFRNANNELAVKVTDFGLSRKSLDTNNLYRSRTGFGPVKWMSPESITDKLFSKQSDVWSFGMVLWEMVTRKVPYEGLDLMEAGLAIISGKVPDIPKECPVDISHLMQECWSMKPESRPSFRTMYPTTSTNPL